MSGEPEELEVPEGVGASEQDHVPEEGWVAEPLAAEFPELRLLTTAVKARRGRSPRALRARLRLLSDRFRGAQAVEMRRRPVPHAYRVFFREIGLDPDATRTPIEAAALDRLIRGGFGSNAFVEDALLLALVETGVPVWALDDGAVHGRLGLRLAGRGERLGTGELAHDLAPGRIVVADEERPAAVLFGDIAAGHDVTRDTEVIRLFSVQVAGVPSIHVEEALWACAGTLAAR